MLCECQAYFSDPCCTWQRGTIENTYKLICRYLPKGISFNNITQYLLNSIAREINNRPQAVLEFLTPYETMFYNFVAIKRSK